MGRKNKNAKKKKKKRTKGEKNFVSSEPGIGAGEPATPIKIGKTIQQYKESFSRVKAWWYEHDSNHEKWGNTVSELTKGLIAFARTGVRMADSVARSLLEAIRGREEAHAWYYHNIKGAADNIENKNHWYFIVQLKRIYELFHGRNVSSSKKVSRSVTEKISDFSALTLNTFEDDEQSDIESDEIVQSNVPIVRKENAENDDWNITLEEEKAMEQQFAMICTLMDAEKARSNIRSIWTDWANDDPETNSLLLSAACTSQYILEMLRATVAAHKAEFESREAFEEILGKASLLNVGDGVVLINLNKESLNGSKGTVVGQINGKGRYPIKLSETRTISVKPENISLGGATAAFVQDNSTSNKTSNSFIKCLRKTYAALCAFDINNACDKAKKQGEKDVMSMFEGTSHWEQLRLAVESENFEQILNAFMEEMFPSWVLYSKQMGKSNASFGVFYRYIEMFADTGKVTFILTFAIVAAIDCISVVHATNPEASEIANDDVLFYWMNEVTDCWEKQDIFSSIEETYKAAGPQVLASPMVQENLRKLKHHMLNLRNVFDFMHRIRKRCGKFCPWMSGELLYSTSRQYLVQGLGPIYQVQGKYRTFLHIYWMLRNRGYLGHIQEIHDLVRVYRKVTFFRGDLARGGCNSNFVSNWLLAIGMPPRTLRAIKHAKATGKMTRWAKNKAKKMKSGRIDGNRGEKHEGMHITEVSRLMDIMQWKRLNVDDDIVNQIRKVSVDEFDCIFSVPLIKIGAKVFSVLNPLVSMFSHIAHEAGIVAGRGPGKATNPDEEVARWLLGLGDECEDSKAAREDAEIYLPQIAALYKNVFDVKEKKEIIPLEFNPNEHEVDTALFGDFGCKQSSYNDIQK